MKKLIFCVAFSAISLLSFSQEFTLKGAIEKIQTTEVQSKIKAFAEKLNLSKYLNELDQDLLFTMSDSKVTVKSKSDFEYVKINNQKLPKTARFNFLVFDIEFKITKKGGQIVCEIK